MEKSSNDEKNPVELKEKLSKMNSGQKERQKTPDQRLFQSWKKPFDKVPAGVKQKRQSPTLI